MARQNRPGDNEERERMRDVTGRILRYRPNSIRIVRDGAIAKTAVRISPSSPPHSAAGSIHESIGDYGDTERFARMAALMAMLGDEINDYGSAIHSELQRQLDEKKYQEASDTVHEHLRNLSGWQTPPLMPPLSGSSTETQSSATSATKRNRFVERELRNREFHFLLEQHNQFHDLMGNLNGLREWWSTNRAEWCKRRDAVLAIGKLLNDFAFRMDHVDEQERLRLQYQFNQQLFGIREILDWFPKNERLQKKVKTQFKRIRRDAGKLQGIISPLNVVKEWRPTQGHGFQKDIKIENIENMEGLPWYHEYGFMWWLQTNGADHLQYCLDRTKAELVTTRNKLEEGDITIGMKKQEIKNLEEEAPENEEEFKRHIMHFRNQLHDQQWIDMPVLDRTNWNDRLRVMTGRMALLLEIRRQRMSEKWDLLTVLHEEKTRLEFNLQDLQRRQERQKTLLDLVNALLSMSHFDQISDGFANQLYNTLTYNCWYENTRNALGKVMESVEFIRSDRLQLLELVEASHAFHDLHHQELVKNAQETINKVKNGEDVGKDWAGVISLNMKEQLESLMEINRQAALYRERRRQNLNSPRIDLGEADGDRAKRSFQQAVQEISETQVWGHVSSLKQAQEILSGERIPIIAGYRQPALQALRSFFVSPDITPTFAHLRNKSKPHFLRLVNGFLQTPLTPRIMEAFLVYCYHVGDLFTVSMTGNISTYTEGWEVAHEMPIAGPIRRANNLPKPQAIADLETWFQKAPLWASTHFKDFDKRGISQAGLIAVLRKRYPPFKNLPSSIIVNYLHYLHTAGRFYKFKNTFLSVSGEPLLLRIDNGWDLSTTSSGPRFDPLFDNRFLLPKPWFRDLDHLRDHNERLKSLLKNAYVRHEETLFGIFEPFLADGVGGFMGWRRVVVTRHRFRLWLRWCDQKGVFVRLTRGSEGTLKLLE